MLHIKPCKAFGKHYLSLYSLNRNKIYIKSKSDVVKYKKELITDRFKRILKQLVLMNYDMEDEVLLLSENEQKILSDRTGNHSGGVRCCGCHEIFLDLFSGEGEDDQ